MFDGILECSSIYIYSYGELNGFWKLAGMDVCWQDWKTEMLFQKEKTVLPGSAVLNQQPGISVVIISRTADLH